LLTGSVEVAVEVMVLEGVEGHVQDKEKVREREREREKERRGES
jgi:hypothetical protein